MRELTPYISNYIESQFPALYRDEGPELIAFIKAYYEWMETDDQILNKTRNLLNYRNVDTTLDEFLKYFLSKYLYGIPRNILGDKKLLIKYALDLYRSKGSVEGYKLLFRLLYNQDIEVYFPSSNILKTSDGIWKEPKYLEITDNSYIPSLISKTIKGFTSNATAIAEKYIRYPVNNKIIGVLYISNIIGEFLKNETIFDTEYDVNSDQAINGPKILGSVSNLKILQGAKNFSIGDILKSYNSSGIDAEFRVSNIDDGVGQLTFDITDSGTYYSLDATEMLTRIPVNNIRYGSNAYFDIGSIVNFTPITYNTDILYYVKDISLDANDYGFLAAANIATPLIEFLNFETKNFGSIASLTNINVGSDYNANPIVTVRDLHYMDMSNNNVYYSNDSIILTGNSTTFSEYLYSANASCALGADWGAIANTSSLTINLSTSSISGTISVGSLILGNNLPSHPNYAFVSEIETIGSNTKITANFPVQNVNVSAASSNSLNFYFTNEKYIKLLNNPLDVTTFDVRKILGVVNNTIIILDDYPLNSGNGNIIEFTIVDGGLGYSNSDSVDITANVADTLAVGANVSIKTTGLGSIYEVVINDGGSGYYNIPTANVITGLGVGANLVISKVSNPKYQIGLPLLNTLFGRNGTSNSTYQDLIRVGDNSMGGENSIITADAAFGSGVISAVQVKNSGIGFDENSIINLRKSGALSEPVIINSGNNYSNGEQVIFYGGAPTTAASAQIVTNSNGNIVDINMIYFGANYQNIPEIGIRSTNGSGAKISTSINSLDTTYIITATPIKTGIGRERGYWTTTQGFLNSDQKIQDSYYYQDYSYEIRTSSSLDRYANIVKKIFHLSGTELFGLAQFFDKPNSNSMIVANSEFVSANDDLISPTLDISFIDGTELDSRITFSRNSNGSYYNANGYIQYVTNNIPRIDHDPITLKIKGILIEDSSQNNIKYSQDFTNITWVKSNTAAAVANSAYSPDMSYNASLLSIPPGATIHQTMNITSNVWTTSIWLKAEQNTVLTLTSQTNISNAVYSVITANSIWNRFELTNIANVGGETSITFTISSVDFPYIVYAWGAQNEVGGTATSYMPTANSANTRQKDLASISGNNMNSWFNRQESKGTFIIKAIWPEAEATNRLVLGLSNGEYSNSIYHSFSNTGGYWNGPIDGGNPAIHAQIGNTGGYHKIAFGYDGNTRISIVDGSIQGSTTSTTTPPVADYNFVNLGGGWSTSGVLQFNGHIQELIYFNYKKSNTSIQTLTSL